MYRLTFLRTTYYFLSKKMYRHDIHNGFACFDIFQPNSFRIRQATLQKLTQIPISLSFIYKSTPCFQEARMACEIK